MYSVAKVATTVLALGSLSLAQTANQSLCDKYTTALLKDNNGTNQYTLLTLIVNTVVIGNYTKPNVGITVPGILAPGTFNGTKVNLLPYFDGGLMSTNDGGSSGVSKNFLDDGGAAPLKMNKPSNGNMTSNQYMLLTHLYQFFGILLGCSDVGTTGFPQYGGDTSMGNVHKFMDLDNNQLGYFIQQVGMAAASFGVTDDDVKTVGGALEKLFGYKCAAAMDIVPMSPPQTQAICQAQDCPTAANATCAAYGNNGTITYPMSSNTTMANGTSSSGNSSSTGTATGSSSSASGSKASAAGKVVAEFGFAAVMAFAVTLLL